MLLLLIRGKLIQGEVERRDKGQVAVAGERWADIQRPESAVTQLWPEPQASVLPQVKSRQLWSFTEMIYRWFTSMQQCRKKRDTDFWE